MMYQQVETEAFMSKILLKYSVPVTTFKMTMIPC